jgi:hypothetical protein
LDTRPTRRRFPQGELLGPVGKTGKKF